MILLCRAPVRSGVVVEPETDKVEIRRVRIGTFLVGLSLGVERIFGSIRYPEQKEGSMGRSRGIRAKASQRRNIDHFRL